RSHARSVSLEAAELFLEPLVVLAAVLRLRLAQRRFGLLAPRARPAPPEEHDAERGEHDAGHRQRPQRSIEPLVRRHRDGARAEARAVVVDDRGDLVAAREARAQLGAHVLGPAAAAGVERQALAVAALAEQP